MRRRVGKLLPYFHSNGEIKLQVGHLKSWASKLSSPLVFKYMRCLIHSINNLKSQKLVVYIFAKQIVFSEVTTYRLEACNFIRKEMIKISRQKFFQDLKKTVLLKPYRKTSVVGSVSIKIPGRYQNQICAEKKLLSRRFSCKYNTIFGASS